MRRGKRASDADGREREMSKIVAVLALMALPMLAAGLAHDATLFDGRVAAVSFSIEGSLPATATPPLMYAGIRG
jgi:hypothetical protein